MDVVPYTEQPQRADIQMHPHGIQPVMATVTLDGRPVNLADIATVTTQVTDVQLTKDRYVRNTPPDNQWSQRPAYRGDWPDSIRQALQRPFLDPDRRRGLDQAANWLDTITDRPRERTLETMYAMVGAFFEPSQVYNVLSDRDTILVPGGSRAARDLADDINFYSNGTALPLWEFPSVVWPVLGSETGDVVWVPKAFQTESKNVGQYDPQLLRMAGLEAPPAPREVQQATRLIPERMDAGQTRQQVHYQDHVLRPARPRDPVFVIPAGMRRGDVWRTATLAHIAINQKLTDIGLSLTLLAHPQTPIELARGNQKLYASIRNAPRTIALLANEALGILRQTASLADEPARKGSNLQFHLAEQIVTGQFLQEAYRASSRSAAQLTGTPIPELSRVS